MPAIAMHRTVGIQPAMLYFKAGPLHGARGCQGCMLQRSQKLVHHIPMRCLPSSCMLLFAPNHHRAWHPVPVEHCRSIPCTESGKFNASWRTRGREEVGQKGVRGGHSRQDPHYSPCQPQSNIACCPPGKLRRHDWAWHRQVNESPNQICQAHATNSHSAGVPPSWPFPLPPYFTGASCSGLHDGPICNHMACGNQALCL